MNTLMLAVTTLGTLQVIAVVGTDPISLEYKAGTLSRFAQVLTEGSGVKLAISNELAGARVAVRADSVPLNTILEDIAKVTQSEWVQERDGLTLRRNADTRDSLLRITHDSHLSSIQNALRKVEQGALGLSDVYRRAFASITAFMEVVSGTRQPDPSGGFQIGDPADLLLKELLMSVGAESLAKIPVHRVVVYSSSPTNAQLLLPAGHKVALDRYQETCEALESISGEIEVPNPHLAARWQKIIESARKKDGIGKILLFCSNRGDAMWGLVAVYSPKGMLRTRSATFLPLQPPSVTFSLSDRFAEQINLGPDSKELLALWSDYGNNPTTPSIPLPPRERAKSIVLNPEEFDPLAYAVTDALFSLAGRDNLVAYVPDELLNLCRRVQRSGTLDSRAFWSAVMSANIVTVIEEEGKVLIAPKNPVECEAARISRAALGKCLRSAARASYLSTEHLARLFFDGGDAVTWESIEPYRAHLVGLGVDPASCLLVPDLYRPALELIGSLGDTQLAWLRSGQPLDVRSFNQGQMYFLRQWASQHATVLERTESGTNVPDIHLTGTEAMATGLPPNTLLSMTLSNTEVVRRGTSRTAQWPQWLPLNSSQLALSIASTLEANPGTSMESVLGGQWKLGSQESVSLSVSISEQVRMSCNWTGATQYFSQQWSYSDLPKSFREAVDSDLERLGVKR